MKIYSPDYYSKFKCIADRCKHNCCIGWEIDIDSETLAYYKTINNNFGRRLMDSISERGEEGQFILGENQRCPMLNSRNLCDVFSNLGEEHLCRICTDHPRFRNFFENRTEIGLGLCCEAACELILFQPTCVKLIETHNNDEVAEDTDNEFFSLRQNAFDIAQDRSLGIDERILKLTKEFDIDFPCRSMRSWANALLSLEQLSDEWSVLVNEHLKDAPMISAMQWEIPFEQLLVYLLFRHTADKPECIKAGISFSVLGLNIIRAICSDVELKYQVLTPEMFLEICRLFSSEIEYSAENMDRIYDFLNL